MAEIFQIRFKTEKIREYSTYEPQMCIEFKFQHI